MKTEVLHDSILINDRWEMTQDGIVYDTELGRDIPQWIFELRDWILTNAGTMDTPSSRNREHL